jgi:hypothetical protein
MLRVYHGHMCIRLDLTAIHIIQTPIKQEYTKRVCDCLPKYLRIP